MEQLYEPRGDANEITGQQLAPPYRAEGADQRPPLTFAQAEAHNPFALLGELRDHSMVLGLNEKPAEFHLTELALSAAVVAWWSRWQPLSMHRALMAGASLAEVAAAAGCTEPEAYLRWADWAERQAKLSGAGRSGVDTDELTAIRARLSGQVP